MSYSELDHSKLNDIADKINKSNLQGPAVALRQSKTRVYLLNEFEAQGMEMLVVLVQVWVELTGGYNYTECIWNKAEAIKAKYRHSKL